MGKLTVDKELIRELAALLDETGLTEIEVEDNDVRIRIARGGTIVHASAPAAGAAPAPAAASAPVNDVQGHPGLVTSPMVGTIYTAAEPGSPPFVKVGDKVTAGQTVLIVEAMKTMNPVTAPKSGTVSRILISNEQPVEYGEPLLIIE
ncbi:acetyl-CoA carboxylase biotin carboxyl carrier protein [Iodidimonas sp. SYSU 1G8]|uniref:acetyl-CoA carboxylase biotin carboxyl carrier protein n=1 Tax=Iodidimonas sp. SYSU 1G8 TaxID=3133967 RepID=UPI0031FE5F48